ncbi:twin transmembrane helix small protein [Alphaproteobacteria bacterium]|nr:twin transmembrane helix small protein [Alphaproteobacteria bacterium]
MQYALPWLIIFAVGGTVIVLTVGVITMLQHGKANAKISNKLMRYRIYFQFAAIVLIGLAYIVGSR